MALNLEAKKVVVKQVNALAKGSKKKKVILI
jgi:hypothetical protein